MYLLRVLDIKGPQSYGHVISEYVVFEHYDHIIMYPCMYITLTMWWFHCYDPIFMYFIFSYEGS